MLQVKEHLTTVLDCIRRVSGSMQALVFHRNIIKTLRTYLVKNCPTRLDSLFLVICRTLEVKERIATVLEELELENLNLSQWKH